MGTLRELHPLATAWAGGAEDYERARPEYPADLVERVWEAVDRPARLLDLAAGTGKLTRHLVELAEEVVAVEPLAEMRRLLARRRLPIELIDGTAEELPCPDRSFDAVFVGEAFHWFRADRALPEISRVLRPRGALALLWMRPRYRDAEEWLLEIRRPLLELHARAPARAMDAGDWRDQVTSRGLFDRLDEQELDFIQRLPATEVGPLVGSWSYVMALPDAERASLLGAIRDRAEAAADARGEVRFPWRAHTAWARRR